MNLRLMVLGLAIATAPVRSAHGQGHKAAAIGTWRGTSLCAVRPSPCNDEHVVYRVTALAERESVAIDMRKLVDGQEEEMAVLRCGVAATRHQLTCAMPNGAWRLELRSDSLVGELRLPNDRKYRDVRTARSR